ncbi:28S ribosomal protein S29, mitochondrial isoform X4 [Oncorhynchus tshawytscha]|uniref:28S ribosomal protein S29, mitochondrial isoform X4 n=1 Tax=Oncorhynchus tshawytscha TaxID=74940 RepID=UPI000D09D8AB|nr:28S ribosomal protein S29, mitochondrial isoform X4 [Oncorhynchus tshawytscha]
MTLPVWIFIWNLMNELTMALHRLSLRLRQTVAQVRPLHGSGCGQQQEAVGMETRPETFSIFRTQENNPACQSEQHLGQYYTVPPSHFHTVFPHGLPPRYQQQVKTFNEGCVMVRQPALELISHLKRADYSKPTLRYLLYGVKGSGKTMSLCHAVHYFSKQGWLVLHIPDAHLWVKNCKELLPSSYHASRFDQPIQASNWLRNFRTTNEHFLSKIKLRQRYVWTKRESTEEGRPLGELVDMGVSHVKSSSDVVGAVLKELRLQAWGTEGGFRMAVAVGVNGLWGRTTLKKEEKSPVAPEELTLVHNLRKMINNDWEGFDSMDPFVPVPVSLYSEKEFESCYLYYLDRHWLQHPHSQTEEGKKELIFLSNRNPSVLERLCAFL